MTFDLFMVWSNLCPSCYGNTGKMVREKSRECHNHKPQLPRPQEEEETDKSKQAQIEQTYEKHKDYLSLPQAR